jgi:hypothetical protein
MAFNINYAEKERLILNPPPPNFKVLREVSIQSWPIKDELLATVQFKAVNSWVKKIYINH